MEKSAVYHISEHNYSYATGHDTLNVRLKARVDDFFEVYVYYANLYDHSGKYSCKRMEELLVDDFQIIYEAQISIKERHFKYYFSLHGVEGIHNYTADGFLDTVNEINCFYYPVINDDEIIDLPKWAKGLTIYQIFVDRFYDGDSSNNPPETKRPHELPDRNTYYGGDFEGIIKKLDYIKDLGGEIIYLSPVFLSPSYHKYDISDYYRVEDIFGGKDKLKSLVDKSHKKGIRVILDGVFNHCSFYNEIFSDVVRYEEKSRYLNWFTIQGFPIDRDKPNYDTFAGLVPDMPRFNTSNPEVIEYLTDAVLYWTRELDIDGWRLDVADEVSHTFWRELRRKIKAYRNDVLIMGEVWNHSSKWLQGDEFDTVTNYKFRKWMIDFAKGYIDSERLWTRLSSNKMLYKTPFYGYMVNLLGSHDTIRLSSLLEDDELHSLLMAAMLMMDGMPLIYYGDEVLMKGGEDPDNRRAMQWNDNINKTIHEAARFRVNNEVIKKGLIKPIKSDSRVLAFRRFNKGSSLFVAINFDTKESLVKGNFKEVLLGDGVITDKGLEIKGKKYVIVREK